MTADKNSSNYDEFKYRRDFIVLKKQEYSTDPRSISPSFLFFDFFDYDIYADKLLDVNFFFIKKRDVGVCLLGYALNPFTKANDNKAIVQHLTKLLDEDELKFFDYLDQLSGRFLLICKKGEKEFLLQDAIGYRCALYSTDPNKFMIASHTKLFQEVFNFSINEDAFKISQHEKYSMGGNYLPGLLTALKDVRPLLANTYLLFSNLRVYRFFPREELRERELTKDFIDNVSVVLRNQNKMLTSRFKVVLSLTGGLDSRISLATLTPVKNELEKVFTYIINGNASHRKDINIAPKIAKDMNISQFQSVDVSRKSLNENSFLDDFQKEMNSGIKKSSADIIAFYLAGLKDPSLVHYMSYGPEIFNCYFSRNPINRDGKLTLDKLGRLYKRALTNLTESAWSEFIEYHQPIMDETLGYCPYDLLYWEHRNSAWLGARMSDADMISDTFVPFNNRQIIKEFLSINKEVRRTKEIHLKLIEHNCPQLLDFDYT